MQKTVATEALQMFSSEEAVHYRLLPYDVGKEGKLLCLGDEGTDYERIVSEISIIYGYSVVIEKILPEELSKLLAVHYRKKTMASAGASVLKDEGDFVGNLIDEAYGMRASDIHLEPFEGRCRVRFRVDGKLLERHVIGKADYPGIVNRIKILSNLDISEKRLPQDGRIMYTRNDIRFDIRTSVMPTLYGEKIVLRLLTRENRHLSLEELGFDERQYRDYREAISKPHGLILISGPTGSGKSTTLYATLSVLNREDNNILTIEDPVEYTLEGVNQVQLKEEIGLDFTAALRTFLRQDPDIIMLGEIRDEATAEMAIRSSMTGHLLLSTLHTNSAWGCITRLSDMGVHPYLLAETLIACVAQRLVRVLCPHCKREIEPDPALHRDLGISEAGKVYARTGCEHCFYTGYLGRKAVYEIIPIGGDLTDAVKNLKTDICDHLRNAGIKTLRDSALALYAGGQTSLEEILPLLKETL